MGSTTLKRMKRLGKLVGVGVVRVVGGVVIAAAASLVFMSHTSSPPAP